MAAAGKCETCGATASDLIDGLCSQCRSVHTATARTELENARPGDLDRFSQTGLAQTQFGDYDLIEEVARGGMGVIYKARHRTLNRIAALKMILSGRFSSEEELQRFHIEAEAAANLDHPGIVPVYEIGEVDGQAFFSMKFIDGASLAERIEQFPGQPRAAVELLTKVVRAVHHAHQRGILHRDLKPANILIDAHGEPLVTDLGLAKNTAAGSNLTNTGAVLGTPSYMAPEQAFGNPELTTAVDVYSLGAIMYELLTGHPPYKGETAVETVMQVRKGPPDPPHKKRPDIDRDLELICMKCLEHDPDARYETALGLAIDLDAWIAGDAISIKAPSLFSRAIRWFRNNRRLAYIGFAVLMGILLTMPFAISFLSSGNSFGAVYTRFPDDQRPLLFSLGEVPEHVSFFAAIVLLFVLWPSVGFLNVLVTQPKTVRQAIRAGTVTSMILVGIFYLLLGWMPLMRAVTNDSGDRVRVLSRAIWQPTDKTPGEALQEANDLFAGLEKVPVEERADVVADRISTDQIATAPIVVAFMFLFACGLCLPIVYGAVLAQVLVHRGNRLWLCFVRYAIAWWSISLSFSFLLGALSGRARINGQPISESPGMVTTIVAVLATIAYLTLRQWHRSALVETPRIAE